MMLESDVSNMLWDLRGNVSCIILLTEKKSRRVSVFTLKSKKDEYSGVWQSMYAFTRSRIESRGDSVKVLSSAS